MNLMGVIGLQIKGFTIQNFEAVAFTQVTFNIKRLDVETCLANIFHLQKKRNLELISKHTSFGDWPLFQRAAVGAPRPSLPAAGCAHF